MAEKYNVTDYRGSIYVFKDNAFTGEVIPMWDSVSKNKAIDELVEKFRSDELQDSAYSYECVYFLAILCASEDLDTEV